jgi:hypothetical protein
MSAAVITTTPAAALPNNTSNSALQRCSIAAPKAPGCRAGVRVQKKCAVCYSVCYYLAIATVEILGPPAPRVRLSLRELFDASRAAAPGGRLANRCRGVSDGAISAGTADSSLEARARRQAGTACAAQPALRASATRSLRAPGCCRGPDLQGSAADMRTLPKRPQPLPCAPSSWRVATPPRGHPAPRIRRRPRARLRP